MCDEFGISVTLLHDDIVRYNHTGRSGNKTMVLVKVKSPLAEAFRVFTSGRPNIWVVLANASFGTVISLPHVVNIFF